MTASSADSASNPGRVETPGGKFILSVASLSTLQKHLHRPLHCTSRYTNSNVRVPGLSCWQTWNLDRVKRRHPSLSPRNDW